MDGLREQTSAHRHTDMAALLLLHIFKCIY